MTEEEKIFAGKLYCPADPDLRARKLRAHNLCTRYNAAFEDDAAQRSEILRELFASLGADSFLQGPIYIHYGCHTTIGERFFGNFNLTVQDDAPVVIGDDCCFGPGATIVTPLHPLLPDERRLLKLPDGSEKRVCYAKPVKIGSNCWFGANVTVCPGVTIGDNCVIGAAAWSRATSRPTVWPPVYPAACFAPSPKPTGWRTGPSCSEARAVSPPPSLFRNASPQARRTASAQTTQPTGRSRRRTKFGRRLFVRRISMNR